ncbi:hypothetical protein WHR41_09580 [Cladosporium halotolerans]|uniref:Uncharacterized protein n=1 Tax=Cladosporium halotolerans TaxID=1052096 RepID=A0AB34KCK8_9PEZI
MAQPKHDTQENAEFSVEVFVYGAVEIRAAAWPSACFNRGPVRIKMKCPGWGVYKASADLAPIPFNARARVSQSPRAGKSSASAQACSDPSKNSDQRGGTTEAFETFSTGKTQSSEGSAWCPDGRAARQDSQTPTIPDSFCSRVPKRMRSGRQSADPLTSECGPARKSVRVSQRQKTARAMHERSP